MGVYKDQNLAKFRLKELNSLYAENEIDIVVISDGVIDENFAEFCKGIHSLHYEVGDRRKLSIEFGGAWVERFMARCLELSDFDILLKIDPDTKFFRRFNYFPNEDYFGNRRKSKYASEYDHIQGGCKGFKREAVERILESGLLQDEFYKGNMKFAYNRFSQIYIRPGEEPEDSLLMVEDALIWDVVKRIGGTIGEWDEVNCHTPTFVPDNLMDGDYAAIHPIYGS